MVAGFAEQQAPWLYSAELSEPVGSLAWLALPDSTAHALIVGSYNNAMLTLFHTGDFVTERPIAPQQVCVVLLYHCHFAGTAEPVYEEECLPPLLTCSTVYA